MAAKILTVTGIILATIGTVFTLWTMLHTDPKRVGTYGEPIEHRKQFSKEKKKTWIGCSLIVAGGLLQVFGQFA